MRPAGFSLRPFWLATMVMVAYANGYPASAQPAAGAMQPTQADILKGFEPAADQPYQLGSGDEITIDVNGRPELSGKHVVGPDGRITLPVAGDLKLAGSTRVEAARQIQVALSAFYQNITVSLSVDRYTSNHLLVLGAVEHPGLMMFDDTPTLLEVVSRAGLAVRSVGQGSAAATNLAESAQATVPELCLIYRAGQAVATVQLRKLLKDGDPLANMRLKRDDIVFVPGDTPFASVLGNVSHPGLVKLESTSTLPQLLAESGGLTDKTGRYPKILIVHAGLGDAAGTMETVSFKDVLGAKPLHLVFHSGDIIYVPESDFNRAGDSLQKISPLLTLVTLGALLN